MQRCFMTSHLRQKLLYCYQLDNIKTSKECCSRGSSWAGPYSCTHVRQLCSNREGLEGIIGRKEGFSCNPGRPILASYLVRQCLA